MERPMIPAGESRKYTTFDKMAERYKVDRTAPASRWTQEEGFPSPLRAAGQGGTFVFDEEEVDAWVREHHFGAWLQSRSDRKNPLDLPAGGPRDLLPLRRIGELEGRALGREATPIPTLRSYISKGTLAQADRVPDDGLQPVVIEPMWFRETAYAYISRPRRVRRASADGETKAEATSERRQPDGPLLDLDLPKGKKTDLLSLAFIGELDGKARGRGKATAVSTLHNYRSQGLLAPPDRTPDDGKKPPVDEPKWFRSTAYTFIRRPGRLGAGARVTKQQPAGTEARLDVKLPAGEDTDLLTLAQIGKLDAKARGRGKNTPVSTMRTYLYKAVLEKADRTPGDGQEPPVDEPKWFRSTAYTFIRRPGRPGGERR